MQPSTDPSPPPSSQGLIIGPLEAPLVTVTPLTDTTPTGTSIKLAPEAEAAIAGLLQALPSAMSAATATSGAYLLRFAPHISAQLAGGQATLMQAVEGGARAIAVDAQGRILGHGTLVPLTGLNPALAAAALWQAAAIVTAQHYLVAMQRQLSRLEAEIGEVRDWLHDREVAGLVTSARYLQDALDALSGATAPVLPDRVANQVEQIAREAAQVVEARRMALVRAAERVRLLPLTDPIWWNVERNVGALREILAAADGDAQAGAIGLAVWAAANGARRAVAGGVQHDQADWRRLAEARTQLGEVHRQVGNIAIERLETIEAPSDLRRVLPNFQHLVRTEIEAAAAQRIATLAAVEHALSLAEGRADADPSEPGLVARCTAEGVWSVDTYQPAPARGAPWHAIITADVLRRLMRVPKLTLANLEGARFARARFHLSNGMTISTWRNPAGFHHVYVINSTERAIFGGFVPWNNSRLEDALQDIWRRYGLWC